MHTSDFDYNLPSEAIAQSAIEPRDASRLLVIHRDSGDLEHRIFRDLPDYLRPGDVLPLGHPISVPLEVTVNETVFAHAVPGNQGARLACLVVPSPKEEKRR